MSKEKKYLLYGMVLVLIAAMGLTFAYFAAGIEGSKKVINVTWADLKIVFNNGDAIQADNIKPGWSTTNTFSVENQTRNVYKYNIVIERLINTFVTKGFLKYKITSTDGGYNMTEFKDVPKSEDYTSEVLAYSVEIPGNSTHNYTIEFVYEASDTVDQSDDMGKELEGNLYISKGTKLLTNAILEDNPTISERTDFSVTNVANTTGTIYKTNKTEDGSDVYYYSGNTTNNWVKFGGFYWRIIRTNEDGSVRMLYSGTSYDTTEGYIGTSKFNTKDKDPMDVGYMYGTSGSLENNRTNENDSTIKTYIDTWYEKNLLSNYDKYISKTAIYCNDRSVVSGTYSTSNTFYYGSYTRLSSNKAPSYKCGGNGTDGLFEGTQAIADKFSANTSGGGNGQLKYPIALMTADEISFAGGVWDETLASPYVWYYTNSVNDSITGLFFWWLLSSYGWHGVTSSMFGIGGSYNPGLFDDSYVDSLLAVRPAISLDSCVQIKSGDGTQESPYEIDYENSCN